MVAKSAEKALLQDMDLAALLGVNKSTIWSWFNSGRIPAPVKIGGITRWRRQEIDRWITAGCPPREKWNASEE